MTDYCSRDDVKKRLAGDGVNISDSFDLVLSDKCTEVSADIDRMVAQARNQPDGWSFIADQVASERFFRARPGSPFLPIDDCVAISAVKLYSTPGHLSRALTAMTDYQPVPLQGTPIIAITSDALLGYPALIGVTSRWGYGEEPRTDVRKAAIVEVIRSYLGDRGGNDDRLGITPFGSLMMSKAYTSLLNRLVADYGRVTGGIG